MSALPPDATGASRTRYEIARRLAGTCPEELGQAIALTGSAARVIAPGCTLLSVHTARILTP